MRKISVILPSRGRPEQANKCFIDWGNKCLNRGNVWFILSLDTSDKLHSDYDVHECDMCMINDNRSLVDAANKTALSFRNFGEHDILVLASDDFEFKRHWDFLLLQAIGDKTDFLLKTKDGVEDWIVTFPIMDRIYYERYGYVYHPAYKHMFVDTHLTSVAALTGKLIFSDLLFKHNHYSQTTGRKDEVSYKADATWEAGEKLYLDFAKRNFDIPEAELVGNVEDLPPIKWLEEKNSKKFNAPLLTIAIPTVVGRETTFEAIKKEFLDQRARLPEHSMVEIIWEKDNKEISIGEKRNILAQRAKGDFILMNDDDDSPVRDYLETIIPILKNNPEIDCVGYLEHCIIDNKQYSSIFSSTFSNWSENSYGFDYVRTPFYKSPIKTAHVKKIGFKDLRFAEDHDFAIRLKESGLLQREYFVNKILSIYQPVKEGSFEERYGFRQTSEKYVALSCTDNPEYVSYLPLVVWAWQQWGFEPIVFIPDTKSDNIELALSCCKGKFQVYKFECEEKRTATYSQCSRIFAGSIPTLPSSSYLLTSDIDMLPCNDFFNTLNTLIISVVGEDLTDYREYPICYIGMPVSQWRQIMGVKPFQVSLNDLIANIEGENIRGEQWSLDQWYATKKIKESGAPVYSMERGRNHGGGSLNRADRDGWQIPDYCIDAHLPRPANTPESIHKLSDLLTRQFPNDNFEWFFEFLYKLK